MKKLLFLLLFACLATIQVSGAAQSDTIYADSIRAADSIISQVSAPEISPTDSGMSNIIPAKSGFTFDIVRILRGLLGMAILLLIAWAFSKNRKAIPWKTVLIGLGIQLALAIGILYVPVIQIIFEFVGKIFVKILYFTGVGTRFLFGSGAENEIATPLQTFAVNILPTIIFFSAITKKENYRRIFIAK